VDLLRVAVLARALDVSAMTIRRMCVRGELRALKVGKTWRISHYGEGGVHEYLQRAQGGEPCLRSSSLATGGGQET